MADDPYRVIKTNVLPQLTEVRLYEDTVEKIARGHREVPIELPMMQDAIATAVANPTHVESSYRGSYVYVDAESTNASGDPLRVPVKPIEGTSGRVRSAFFASSEDNPEIVWRRGRE